MQSPPGARPALRGRRLMTREKYEREQRETMEMIKDGLTRVQRDGFAECSICGKRIHGRNLKDILTRMGCHGEREHPEAVNGI